MCILTDDDNGGIHECIVDCPLCWIFISAENKRKLILGERIDLGTAQDLMLANQEGCIFARYWLSRLLRTEHGPVGRFWSGKS